MLIEVILTPAEIALLPGRDLRGVTCVVFDVLRATSTILTALSKGARRIVPVRTAEEAQKVAQLDFPGALLGGERGGLRLDGFNLGNSPSEYTTSAVSGRDIVMTTTNGTVALKACAHAAKVYAGALINLAALLAAIDRQTPRAETILLICAGSGEGFALEDGLAAGALAADLPGGIPSTDATLLVQALHAAMGNDLPTALSASSNGRRLVEIGLAADVAYCAQLSILGIVAVLDAGVLRVESV